MIKFIISLILLFIIILIIILFTIIFNTNKNIIVNNEKFIGGTSSNEIINYIEINNIGDTLNNYQINFLLNHDPFFTKDFRNIIIIDENGISLPFYIEKITENNGILSASIWVKVYTIKGNTNKDITTKTILNIMINDNLSSGNPDDVFDLYDDFSKLANLQNNNLDKWDKIIGTSIASDTNIIFENNMLKIPNNTRVWRTLIQSKNIMPKDCTFEVLGIYATPKNGAIPSLIVRGNNNNNYGIDCFYDGRADRNLPMGPFLYKPYSGWWFFNYWNGESFPTEDINNDNKIKRKIKIEVIGNNIKSFYSEGLDKDYKKLNEFDLPLTQEYNTPGKVAITNHWYGNVYVDKVRVYKASNNKITINITTPSIIETKSYSTSININELMDIKYEIIKYPSSIISIIDTKTNEQTFKSNNLIYNVKSSSSYNDDNLACTLFDGDITTDFIFKNIYKLNIPYNEYIIINFLSPIIIKVYGITASIKPKFNQLAPQTWDLYYLDNNNEYKLLHSQINKLDINDYNNNYNTYLIKDLLNNNISSKSFKFVFNGFIGNKNYSIPAPIMFSEIKLYGVPLN